MFHVGGCTTYRKVIAKRKNWYMCFLKIVNVQKALEEIQYIFREEHIEPRQLTIEMLFKGNSEIMKEYRYAFPGYIFISSYLENDEFIM